MKKLLLIGLSLLLVLGLTGCGKDDSSSDTLETTVVKVGVVGTYNDQWDTVNELLKDENIQVELVFFSDYALPNKALNEGELDLNAFQHYAFLENDCNASGYDLTAIGETIFAPLGVFHNKDKISSVEDIKDGDIIAIPSDATNGGRALKILEEMGLIVCDPETGLLPKVYDIVEYKVDIEIMEIESAMLASILPEVSAALINGGNAFTAGLHPLNDTIYIETITEDSERLKNVIVARSEDADNEVYKKIVEAYQSAEVEQTLIDAYGGAFTPAWK